MPATEFCDGSFTMTVRFKAPALYVFLFRTLFMAHNLWHIINMTLNFKMCRAITVLDLWAMTASFYWLLIEGIQLYTLLVVTVFSVKNRVIHAKFAFKIIP